MAEKITDLRMEGFSIEVEEPPVKLLMQTDKGLFNVEIPAAQLSKLIYALRFVLYADEPLKKQRQRKQSAAPQLRTPPGKYAKKPKLK
jgi:hypothetical protein